MSRGKLKTVNSRLNPGLILCLLLCGFFQLSNAQSVQKTMLRLPDTGETTSYTTTFGEDADYNYCAPFFQLNGDGTVSDTITGLMWQQTDGGEMTIENAFHYADTSTLAGYSDWRLPNAHESISILNHQFANPAIDPAVFTVTAAEYWWTSVYQANDSAKVWVTNSGGGVGNHPKSETISAGGSKRFHVRMVRDVNAPLSVQSHFADNGNGTVTDNLTNLVWQKVPLPDSLTWEDALLYVDTLSLAGYIDWRLPNIKELESISDESLISPSIDPTYFSVSGTKYFWSSTTLPNQTTKAWYLDTHFGITTYDVKTSRHQVFAVRGDESFVNGLVEGNASKETYVSPNPFSAHLNLEREAIGLDCVLRDAKGKVIYHGKELSEQNFEDLGQGTYLLTIYFNLPVTIKLIKQ